MLISTAFSFEKKYSKSGDIRPTIKAVADTIFKKEDQWQDESKWHCLLYFKNHWKYKLCFLQNSTFDSWIAWEKDPI
jgi:hypothetical protein